jgi:pimeloyl-ACP methyl ester carboxylesterase
LSSFFHIGQVQEERVSESVPTVLVPGLLCSARLYCEQIPALWRFAAVLVTDHRHACDLAAMARGSLENSPPRFALAGMSMGGYIAS